MIRFENTDVSGWEAAIRGMRNPMNSWDKSDSFWYYENDYVVRKFAIGENDLTLMKKLIRGGTDHSKFLRMINVTVDITAPRYWWTEFDTYKVGTVRNSCSTMHKIHDKKFEIYDFSHEHMGNIALDYLSAVIRCLNENRQRYRDTGDKDAWWNMIQLLPQSYNQRATVQMNYQVLRTIYHSDRKHHKLDEWRIGFMKWIESLPYAELITGDFF